MVLLKGENKMNFIMVKTTQPLDMQTITEHFRYVEGRKVYTLSFTNVDRTKGVFGWNSIEFEGSTNNMVQFVRQDDYFLLMTSSTSNKNELEVILKEWTGNKEMQVEIIRPLVTKEQFLTELNNILIPFECTLFEEHEKCWYMTSILKRDSNDYIFNYSPINGKGQISMLTNQLDQDLFCDLIFRLLKDNDNELIMN